jgi:hypothetical protein
MRLSAAIRTAAVFLEMPEAGIVESAARKIKTRLESPRRCVGYITERSGMA